MTSTVHTCVCVCLKTYLLLSVVLCVWSLCYALSSSWSLMSSYPLSVSVFVPVLSHSHSFVLPLSLSLSLYLFRFAHDWPNFDCVYAIPPHAISVTSMLLTTQKRTES